MLSGQTSRVGWAATVDGVVVVVAGDKLAIVCPVVVPALDDDIELGVTKLETTLVVEES